MVFMMTKEKAVMMIQINVLSACSVDKVMVVVVLNWNMVACGVVNGMMNILADMMGMMINVVEMTDEERNEHTARNDDRFCSMACHIFSLFALRAQPFKLLGFTELDLSQFLLGDPLALITHKAPATLGRLKGLPILLALVGLLGLLSPLGSQGLSLFIGAGFDCLNGRSIHCNESVFHHLDLDVLRGFQNDESFNHLTIGQRDEIGACGRFGSQGCHQAAPAQELTNCRDGPHVAHLPSTSMDTDARYASRSQGVYTMAHRQGRHRH